MAARGGLLKLLDAYIAIGGDASDFDKVVDQSEAKAKAAGGRLESAFSPRRVLGALGAAAGAVFGVMLTGANQLDAATQRLVADAGLTGKAAEDAGHSLASMYSNNLQGFDAIGAAMTKVHNDLGLTGAAADASTEKFLKFSTATGQDAAGAVTSFDDILDAWNLTAADAGSLMDKLIVSNQKYGGSIADNESALSAMAPAMQAGNMSIDDGIGLLNLFNAAGIEASKAPTMLARAVKLLKPGQDINDLIAQITAIEDPTLRGQKAMEIFGVRGGVGMATALRPGMGSLSDYAISADQAAGASDRAAEASLSWGDKATLALRKVAGPLAEFGTQFGPLLMVASTIGPKLTTALASGLGGLAGLLIPKVTAAVAATGIPAAIAGTGVGKLIGAAISTSTAAAIAIAPFAIAGALGAAIGGAIGMAIEGPVVEKAKADMAKSVGSALANAVKPEDLQHMRQVILDGMKQIEEKGTLFGWDIFGGKDALQKQLDDVDAKIAATAAQIPETVAGAVTDGAPKVEIAVADLVKTFGTSLAGIEKASKQTGTDGMLAMAAGVTAARAKPLDAFGTLVEMLKHQLSPLAEVARLKGELTSKELARGLKSGDPAVRAQASAVAKAAADRLGELAAGGGAAGKAAMAQLNTGIRSKLPEVRAASLAAKNVAVAQLNAAVGPAGTAGSAAGSAFAARLRASIAAGTASVSAATGFWIPGHAAGAWRIPTDEFAFIHADEMVVPAVTASRIRSGEAILSAGGAAQGGGPGRGGATVNVTVYNPKPEPASTSTKRELQKLAAFGVLA